MHPNIQMYSWGSPVAFAIQSLTTCTLWSKKWLNLDPRVFGCVFMFVLLLFCDYMVKSYSERLKKIKFGNDGVKNIYDMTGSPLASHRSSGRTSCRKVHPCTTSEGIVIFFPFLLFSPLLQDARDTQSHVHLHLRSNMFLIRRKASAGCRKQHIW